MQLNYSILKYSFLLVSFITGCGEKQQEPFNKSKDSVQIPVHKIPDSEPISYYDTVKTISLENNGRAQIHTYYFKDYQIVFYNYSSDVSHNDFTLCNSLEIKRNGKILFRKLSSNINEEDEKEFTAIFKNFGKKNSISYKAKPLEKITKEWAQNGALYLDTIAYINKNNIPYLVIKSNHNGGNQGGYDLLIFELGNELKNKLDIFATNPEGDMFSFKDIDGDGIPEVTFHIFLLFEEKFIASMADGMYQKIILHWNDGEYKPYKEKMAQPQPSDSKLQKFAKRYNRYLEKYNNKPGIELFNEMISYAYSGNRISAYKLLDMVWKSKYGSKVDFKNYFDSTSKQCEYLEY